MRQLRESKINTQVISNISFLEDDCLNIAKKTAEGVIVPVLEYNSENKLESVQHFKELYEKKFKKEPTLLETLGYDNLMILAKAISETDGKPSQVASYIRNLKNYDGAIGKINFTNGDVMFPIEFKIIKDGKPIKLEKGNV